MLSIENLSFGYTSDLIAHPFSVRLPFRGIVSVLGRNGSGKTTFLRTISGLLPVRSGNVSINGKDISLLDYKERARYFAHVFSQVPGNLNLSVRELLELNPAGRKTDFTLVQKFIDLPAYENKVFSKLSDGQKQLVMLAKAFSAGTPVVLLDEPGSHLDNFHLKQLQKLMLELAGSKLIFFATHNYPEVFVISNKLCVFTEERIIMTTPEDLVLDYLDGRRIPVSTDLVEMYLCKMDLAKDRQVVLPFLIQGFKRKNKINSDIVVSGRDVAIRRQHGFASFGSFYDLLTVLEEESAM